MAGKGITLLRLALMDFSRNNCPYVAAGIAFWALFSLFPLALAAISIMAYLNPGPEKQGWILQGIVQVIPVSREYLAQIIEDVSQARGTLGVIAALGLIWSGTAVFSSVRKGVNHAWHIGKPPYFLLERATDMVMLLGVAVLAFNMVAFTTNLLGLSTMAQAPNWIGGGLTGKVFLELGAVAMTFGVFLLLYRFLPNTHVVWKDVWLGAAVGAVLSQSIRIGFTWFVVHFGSFNLVYGVLGSLMAAMVWAYLTSIAIMWGAQVCFIYSRLYGSQQDLGIPPDLQEATIVIVPDRNVGGLPGVLFTLGSWLFPAKKRRGMPSKADGRQAMADTLVQFLQEASDKFGSRPALFFKPAFRYRQWSYRQLWEESGKVAALLQQRGLQKGDRAILWAYNCPQWVLAFFGCLRAGVIAVPIDLRSAPEFVTKVVAKTRPKLAFVSRLTPPMEQRMEMECISVEELEGLCEHLPALQDVPVAKDDLAEIMFTSGTTGDPKGVMISHWNLLSNLEAASQYIPCKPSYRLLSVLPLSHMFEQMGCLLMALSNGASVTYPASRQPSVLFRTMRERRITTMLLVPLALDLFMKGIEREVERQGKERLWNALLTMAKRTPFHLRRVLFRRIHKQFGGKLELVISGGAALDPELGAKWQLLGVKVIQGYGATEASPVISCHKMSDPRFDSVGLPLPGVDVKIQDDGEILVRGPNVTRGYWEAPEQSAAAFKDGWYKTGDLGYFDKEGYLHIQGRKKDMIVLADGQNVFPEDVEAVLLKHTAVTDAIVVGLSKGSDTEVHAVFILKEPSEAPAIVTWANSRLEERQRIRGWSRWPGEDFPRTHTLKVKKGVVLDTLRGVAPSSPAAISGTPSTSSTPRALTRIVADVAGVALGQVAAERTLGGDLNLDSLKRVELLSVVEEELGAFVDETTVGPDTTVGQLQAMIGEQANAHTVQSFPGWGMSWWCQPLRGTIQRAFIFPMGLWLYRLRVSGQEHLDGVKGPVLFAANHHLALDNGLIIKAMPNPWRRRLAIAAAADLWGNPVNAVMNPLLGNGFPFAKDGPVRASLDNLGRILDKGWSVLLYPEGELTVGGPMKPFKSGTGLIGVEGGIPVVPLHLLIHSPGKPEPFPFLRRGHVEIRFGKPIFFQPGASYLEATAAIEGAVHTL
ncbi:MAG: YihY family inner membrane protein [Chloroflexi bacterium]|nr:YihY family inner membrane protein [Chloroflexota bacterium]